MPWKVIKKPVKSGKNYAIMKKVNGKWVIIGRSKTKKKAEASVNYRREGSND